ncbi:hypothetical protein PG997_011813 [Apiospora hydei]|uniref:Uncharacterized protein n=1 Tax=Apiospora hydei TaxID=1337664 RepID=A0ABR1V1J0_9PEZI
MPRSVCSTPQDATISDPILGSSPVMSSVCWLELVSRRCVEVEVFGPKSGSFSGPAVSVNVTTAFHFTAACSRDKDSLLPDFKSRNRHRGPSADRNNVNPTAVRRMPFRSTRQRNFTR